MKTRAAHLIFPIGFAPNPCVRATYGQSCSGVAVLVTGVSPATLPLSLSSPGTTTAYLLSFLEQCSASSSPVTASFSASTNSGGGWLSVSPLSLSVPVYSGAVLFLIAVL